MLVTLISGVVTHDSNATPQFSIAWIIRKLCLLVCEQYRSLWSKTGCGRKNAAEKLEAQSNNSDTCDSDTDRSIM